MNTHGTADIRMLNRRIAKFLHDSELIIRQFAVYLEKGQIWREYA